MGSTVVFYTNELKNTYYSFSIKPEISTVKIAFKPKTEEPSLVSYNPGMLDSEPNISKSYKFKPLNKAIQNDNPAWLGKKWPGDKTNWSNDFPFYINVFIQDANQKQSSSENRDAVFSIKTNLTPFITQNITAIKLSLLERNKSQLDQFIAFHQQAMDAKTEGDDKFYLSVNKAFKLSKDRQANKHSSHLHGELTLYLPKTFKSHLEPYTSLGQTIDLGELSIKSIRLDGKQITFEIRGELQKLVQLKLYNKADELISEVFELQHIENNKAHLSLAYQGNIDKFKVVMAQSLAEKKYPFSFSDQ
ncbi:hypothetical protein [sulfur-oxidizing endosymbiont of Gigantopelta aegis]|uniref:hypothetical protein n=1 Tax=sulfur-oxidizing endosymbiont of Gigantopelta aegis TaxID=2794934 RepID=UPI0018DB3DD0|nr:hypothetical protein [sulfur-oxidizing endosymbiont of Gigantopelta aegis]